MSREGDFSVFAVADDLSGAAETAVALGMRGTRSVVLLSARASSADVVVLDTDSRALSPAAAVRAVVAALDGVRQGDRVFKKIDSLLRGNVAAEISALTAHGYGVAVTPALPVAGRVVRSGVLRVDAGGWCADRAVSRPVLDSAPVLGLDVVRGPALADAFLKAADTHSAVVCDAETDDDLDAIAVAAAGAPANFALAGSGGLAAALGRIRVAAPGRPIAPPSPARTVLVVVGTAEAVATQQITRLTGCTVHSLSAADLLMAGPVPIPPPHGVTLLRVDPAGGVDLSRGRAISAGLARTAAAVARDADLALIGGETARRVLDAIGVDALEPLDEIHHGAVRSRASDGRVVVTRPGSFGGPESLAQIVRTLTERHSR